MAHAVHLNIWKTPAQYLRRTYFRAVFIEQGFLAGFLITVSIVFIVI